MTEDLRERIARALYKQGAYCGNCSFEGWDSCAECRQALLSYAVAVLDVLGQERAEVERLREAVGGLTANVKRWRGRASAERSKRQRWRKRALAAEAEVERLRETLRDLADAYRGIALDHPTVVTRHLPLIMAEEVLFGSDDRD